MLFKIRAQRLSFRALDRIVFPAGKAGNILRGAFGKILWGSEDFARFFPPRRDEGPSGLADPPRPFVFRAAHLEGSSIEAGKEFYFDVNLFDLSEPLADALTRACSELAPLGFGTRRGRAEFISDNSPSAIHSVDLAGGAPCETEVSNLQVRFITPVELKGQTGSEIPFGILFARVRDRIGILSSLYGEGPLELDYRAAGERAASIRTVSCELQYNDFSRRSGRTGEVHPIGGFTGVAQYEGELAEFAPWLRAACWTGVGKHTVWGNGVIECKAKGRASPLNTPWDDSGGNPAS